MRIDTVRAQSLAVKEFGGFATGAEVQLTPHHRSQAMTQTLALTLTTDPDPDPGPLYKPGPGPNPSPNPSPNPALGPGPNQALRQRDALLRQLQRDGAPLRDPSGEAYVLMQVSSHK